MGLFFSRKKEPEKPKITEQDKAVLALKQQRDKLKKYQKKIEQNLEKERQLAKELLQQGKKSKAKLLLKKKRYQEQLLGRTDNQLDNLEKMVQDIEFAQVQIQVAEGLKNGNDCLHQLHEIMSIEEVERIMDDTKEAVEYQKEIDDLLSGGLTDEDDDAIMKELDELSESVTEKLPEVPKEDLPINLPEPPTKEPAAGQEKQKEKKETKEAEMVAA